MWGFQTDFWGFRRARFSGKDTVSCARPILEAKFAWEFGPWREFVKWEPDDIPEKHPGMPMPLAHWTYTYEWALWFNLIYLTQLPWGEFCMVFLMHVKTASSFDLDAQQQILISTPWKSHTCLGLHHLGLFNFSPSHRHLVQHLFQYLVHLDQGKISYFDERKCCLRRWYKNILQ